MFFWNRYMAWFSAVVIVSFLAALLARMSFMHRPNGLRTDPLPNPLGFIIPAVIFSVFSGLRNSVGDTEQYIDIFQRLDVEHMEPLRFRLAANTFFKFLEYRIRLQTDDYLPLIMITAVAGIVPVIFILYKYAAPYEMGILLFVLTGYYTWSMNGIRQYMAAAVLALATKYLFSEKKTDFLKYLVFVIFAWTIHSTALIMIPIYFIVRRPAWRPLMFALVGGTIIATLLFDRFLPSFLDAVEDSEYALYAQNGWFTNGVEHGSSFIRILVLFVPLVLAFLWHEQIEAVMGRKWDVLVNLSIFNLMFYILSLYNWLFARLAIYTSLYVVIMMTHLISKSQTRENARYLNAAIAGLYIIYFYNLQDSITGYHSRFF